MINCSSVLLVVVCSSATSNKFLYMNLVFHQSLVNTRKYMGIISIFMSYLEHKKEITLLYVLALYVHGRELFCESKMGNRCNEF